MFQSKLTLLLKFYFLIQFSSNSIWWTTTTAQQQDSVLEKCGKTLHSYGGDNRVSSPWSAIIFHKNKHTNGVFIDWSSGVIVGPSTIITRGRNFWEPGKRPNVRLNGFKSSNFLVGVGIYNRKSFNPDKFTQILAVEYIRPHPKSHIEHSEYDFAIIQLKSNIKFSSKVSPICIQTNPELFSLDTGTSRGGLKFPASSSSSRGGAPSRISGYGRTGNYSIFGNYYKIKPPDLCNAECQLNAPSSTQAELQAGIGSNCEAGRARTIQTEGIEDIFMVGTGIASWHKNKWYLNGIVTKSYGCGSKYKHFISLIVSQPNLDWISGNIQNGGSKYTCLNGAMSINIQLLCNNKIDCVQDGGSDEESAFCEAWKCSAASLNSDACNIPEGDIVLVRNGSNSVYSISRSSGQPVTSISTPAILPSSRPPQRRTTTVRPTPPPPITITSTTSKSIVTDNGKTRCPPLKFTEKERRGIKFRCIPPKNNPNSDCLNNANPGTKILLTCQPHYKSGSSISFTEISCGEDGVWKRGNYFGCVLECGVPKARITGHIVNGTSAVTSNWPWNAALFRKHTSRNEFLYICGATLITGKSLLTAAHCLRSIDGQLVDLIHFRIVLAPISSKFMTNLNDPHTQIMHVGQAEVHELFNSINFEADIAIIKTQEHVQINDDVYPVCFPFPGRENEQIERVQTSPGNTGIVVGFGTDESLSTSQTLKQVELPVVSVQECYRVLDIFPSTTQLCAGYTKGVSVCNGDSGGGLLFQEEGARKLYFIQGIVSYGQRNIDGKICDYNKYSIFTRVGAFKEWVERIVQSD